MSYLHHYPESDAATSIGMWTPIIASRRQERDQRKRQSGNGGAPRPSTLPVVRARNSASRLWLRFARHARRCYGAKTVPEAKK